MLRAPKGLSFPGNLARVREIQHLRSELGQASVEFIAVLPVVLLVAGLVLQLVLVGQGLWLCANAARIAARAALVGSDPEAAARSALPAGLEGGLEVATDNRGIVQILVRLPLVLAPLDATIPIRSAARLGEPG